MKQRLIASLVLISFMLVAWWQIPQPSSSLTAFVPPLPTLTIFSGEAMTVEYHITVGKLLNQGEKENAQRLIDEAFEEIHAVCNQWNPHSLISRCNQMSAGVVQEIPPLLEDTLLLAGEVVRLSEGRYDPTVEPLKQVWMPALKQGCEPSPAQLLEVMPKVGWHQLHVEQGLLWKDHDQLSVNLDSIAKGACVDLLVEKLTAAGFSDLLVEWGGEVRTAGRHPNNRPWQLFIRGLHDTDPDNALARMDLENAAIATSGDYFQYWNCACEADEKAGAPASITYFHIFNPKTLRPLSLRAGSIASVTVRASCCALADALATAGMFCEDLEEAEKWTRQVQQEYPETAFWFAARRSSKL